MKHAKLFLVLLFLFSSVCLTGCGFHFRDSTPSSSGMKTIYIQDTANNRTGLAYSLRGTLNALGSKTVSSAAQSPVTLDILQDNFVQAISVLGTAQQLNSEVLSYNVTIVLRNSKGQNLTSPASFQTNTTFWQSANQILGDSTAIPALKQNLLRDMTQKILIYLNAEDTQKALHVRQK
jgi:outer membrane lipopolysaccharide assembly protein LptE/RlpB